MRQSVGRIGEASGKYGKVNVGLSLQRIQTLGNMRANGVRSLDMDVSLAGVKGLDGGADFAEGCRLDPERAAKMPAKPVGRMLTPPHAKWLLERLER